MDKNDREAFAEILAGLAEIYTKESRVTKEKAKLYFNVFTAWGWTLAQFRDACTELMSTKSISTFPLPAEIKNALQGDRSLNAWLKAQDAAAIQGMQKSVKFDDPTIHSVINAMGGWPAFCMIPMTDDKASFKRMEFERLYNTMMSKDDHPEICIGMYYPENQVDLTSSTPEPFRLEDSKKKEIDG